MANPNPGLQGFADPEVPGWEERALDRVRERQTRSKYNTERKNGMYLFFDDGFRVLLDEAARRRDISMTGYLRRAAAAMIAHDLGMEIEDVLKFCAMPQAFGVFGGKPSSPFDTGEGMGEWSIGRLEGEMGRLP